MSEEEDDDQDMADDIADASDGCEGSDDRKASDVNTNSSGTGSNTSIGGALAVHSSSSSSRSVNFSGGPSKGLDEKDGGSGKDHALEVVGFGGLPPPPPRESGSEQEG